MPSRQAALISLGCSKNLADSEDLVTALRSVQFQLTDQIDAADLVLINTCGFIEDAKKESIDHIFEAAEQRQDNAKLFVAGCLTERYLTELQDEIPEVDQWVTFKDYDRFAALVKEHFPDSPEHLLSHEQRSQLTPPHYAFLKIAEGCDNTCNFCAIPKFRGKHQSRPLESLVEQARVLSERGVKEINMISQHLDYYGYDLNGTYQLPELVHAVAEAAPDSWIRLHYCYPNDFSDELIAAMAAHDNVLNYIDMPIQHASNRSLAQMGRRTTREHIEERLDAIRAGLPDAVLRSTFIVGFPGERDQDFEALMDFMRQQQFDQVGCFKYSDEDGTTAALMPDKVDEHVIEERWHAFMQQQHELHQSKLQRWIGKELTVLVDEQLDFDRFACRHAGQASEVDNITLVEQDGLQVGDWAHVRISGTSDYDLIGQVI